MSFFVRQTLFISFAIVSLGTIALISCTKKSENQVPVNPLVEKGRRAYTANCVSCHNTDPKKDGVLGPAVMGSSLELLNARILEASYPVGYTPKRTTHAMAPLLHVKPEIEALHAFLNETH